MFFNLLFPTCYVASRKNFTKNNKVEININICLMMIFSHLPAVLGICHLKTVTVDNSRWTVVLSQSKIFYETFFSHFNHSYITYFELFFYYGTVPPDVSSVDEVAGYINQPAVIKCHVQTLVPFTLSWQKNGVHLGTEQTFLWVTASIFVLCCFCLV